MIGLNGLSHTMLELYFGGVTRFEFYEPYWDKEGKPNYLFGGTVCVRHSREEPELWRVYIDSPFPGKGLLSLRHQEHGWLMPELAAIQLARKWQP